MLWKELTACDMRASSKCNLMKGMETALCRGATWGKYGSASASPSSKRSRAAIIAKDTTYRMISLVSSSTNKKNA
jgi:hypothetical protein